MAFTTVSDANFRIINARAQNEIEAVLPLPNGSVFAVNSRVFVKCGTGVLELLQVQPASRNVMKAIEWLRGVNSEVTFE
jgi:methionyl-tRNA formyltransferase